MPGSTAALGYGAQFGIKNGATYTYVAEVTNITPPGWKRDTVEVTHLKSDDKYKEFIAGLCEAGEASIEINWLPSTTDALVTAFTAGVGDFRILSPSGTVGLDFRGIVSEYQPGDFSAPDKMSASFKVQATGKVTLTAVV